MCPPAREIPMISIVEKWGGNLTGGSCSTNFTKHMEKLGVQFLGRVPRGINPRKTDKNDPYFPRFLEEKGIDSKLYNQFRFYSPTSADAYLSMKKYFRPHIDMRENEWMEALQWTLKHFDFMAYSRVCEDFDINASKINRDSSPGYPYNSGGEGCNYPKKRDMMTPERIETLKDLWEKDWASLGTQEYVPNPYLVTPKSELRKTEKIENHECRVYLACNILTSLHGYALFGQLHDRFYNGFNKSWSYVGGSTFNREWDALFRRLKIHPNAAECDESGYDSSLQTWMMWSHHYLCSQWLRNSDGTPLSSINRQRLDNFFDELVNTFMIGPDGDLMRKWAGNPSGAPTTTVTNTLILFTLLAYAWIRMRPSGKYGYTEFMKHVQAALCGDDNTYTVSDEVFEWYNVDTVAQCWSNETGIRTKPGSEKKAKLTDCSFISRKFNLVEGVCVPTISHDKMVCGMLYNSQGRRNIRFSLLKSYALRIETFWDRKTFDLFTEFGSWLKNNYPAQLRRIRDPRDPDDLFTYEDIESVNKTRDEILRLYLKSESNVLSAVKEYRSIKEKLSDEEEWSLEDAQTWQ